MIYPEEFESKVGFDRLRKKISDSCLSDAGREKVNAMKFSSVEEEITKELSRTDEFQNIIELELDFPLDHYYDLQDGLNKIKVSGSYLELIDLFNLKRSLQTLRKIHGFFNDEKKKESFPYLFELSRGIKAYPFVIDSINKIMSKEGDIKDNASESLGRIRDELKRAGSQVNKRMQSILRNAQSEGIVEKGTSIAIRNGRGVIPVAASDKNRIKGLIHDQSATGKTVYIEPSEIVSLNNQIIELEYEEKREIIKILVGFADRIRPYINDLLASFDILAEFDFIRSKALLGRRLRSVKPVITDNEGLKWVEAVHPLLYLAFEDLPDRDVVPLDIELDLKNRIMLISGPNAGGKSVCLTTVGLIQYMLQCGLTVPVRQGSGFRLFDKLFINIGDEQSIDNDLSTYSSHLMNMKFFLKNADENTLVLIDEFGTGTEPVLGGSIAEAILAELNRRKVFGVLTTHYSNLKHFASSENGIINGAMLFDNHRMIPLFKLEAGKPGSSFAFEIARRIGLPESILDEASKKAGEEHIDFDKHLKDVLRDKRYWDRKRQNIRIESKKLDELVVKYEKEIDELKKERKEIIGRAKEEAEQILNSANKAVEKTIREIKEAQAEKEKTRKSRDQLDKLREGIDEIQEEQDKKTIKKKELLEKKRKDLRISDLKDRQTQVDRPVEVKSSGPLKAGDKVVMEGSEKVGEVLDIDRKKITIAFGNLKTTVSSSRVRRATDQEARSAIAGSVGSTGLDWDITRRKSRFSPDKDVRGMRAEEALNAVREFIDEGIMVQYPTLRILHGKGDGILRHVIREYLSSVDLVKDYYDEHIDAGGAGITVVDLDL